MGKRGPLPKPYARRRNRRPTAGRVVFVARPAMPRDLPAEAKAEWRRVVPELEGMGLLATVDRGALIRYCTAWADWVELQRLIQQSGKVLKGSRGHLVRNPLWFMRNDAEQTVTELGKQLGLTPAARLRVGVRHEVAEDLEEQEERGSAVILEYKRVLGVVD
jgi:P27 family predicted phage terminase small subunit